MNNQKAFTLIELLVVVLIIGILAAVALPQYQKAVEKSRATQAITLVKSVHQAMGAYYLANGTWPDSLDELAVQIPWTGTQRLIKNGTDTRSNGIWSLQIYKDSDSNFGILAGKLSGKYQGAGFIMFTKGDDVRKPGQLQCFERNTENTSSPFQGETGDYCQKIFKTSGNWHSPLP